jgi:hypothetical protein
MRIHFVTFFACVSFAFALVGCGSEPISRIDASEQLILYSIDGGDYEPGQAPKTDEIFHGYPVLGKVDITDTAKRKEVVAALRKGLANSDGKTSRCFSPRHAIRAVAKGGRTIDYVVCFQCDKVEAYDGDSKTVLPVTREPQRVFNKHLSEAGVPLAPGMVEDD